LFVFFSWVIDRIFSHRCQDKRCKDSCWWCKKGNELLWTDTDKWCVNKHAMLHRGTIWTSGSCYTVCVHTFINKR